MLNKNLIAILVALSLTACTEESVKQVTDTLTEIATEELDTGLSPEEQAAADLVTAALDVELANAKLAAAEANVELTTAQTAVDEATAILTAAQTTAEQAIAQIAVDAAAANLVLAQVTANYFEAELAATEAAVIANTAQQAADVAQAAADALANAADADALAAAEEAARLATEEAARLEAERLAAEEAARLEAERLAAEEAARLEAERLAAEEAARLEAERLAAEEAARLEAERLAAEEAARLEAERLAAEEAEKLTEQISAAQSSADDAQVSANNAAQIAIQAASDATTAQDLADIHVNAQTDADIAAQAAADAQTAAADAQAAADVAANASALAQAAADSSDAAQAATEAQNAADIAAQAALDAQNAADIAAQATIDAIAASKADTDECIAEQYFIESATNGEATVSQEGYSSGLTIDGIYEDTSRWSSEGSNQEIIFDLGEQKIISALQIQWLKGDERTTNYSVETSTDGIIWESEITKKNSDSAGGLEAVNLPESTITQYFKIIGHGNTDNYWNSLIEVEAHKCALGDIDDGSGDGDGDGGIIGDDKIDECDALGQMLYNGSCAPYSEVYEVENGEVSEDAHIISAVPLEMTFDALAAQETTPNGNGWRHELKIKSSGDYRVGMTEVYELFKATITIDLDNGAKTIVAQHHAATTETITKLYIADLNEGSFENAPDGTESDSVAMNGIFDVYIRLANPDGDGETKHLLTTMRTGESFNFEEENDHGVVTVKINGQAIESIAVADSSASYFKFGNYQQAQYPVANDSGKHEKLDKDTLGEDFQDYWPAFYAEYFSTSKIMFTNMSYTRLVGDETPVTDNDDDDTIIDDDNDDVVVDCSLDDSCPEQGGDFVGNGTILTTSPSDLADTLAAASAGDEIIVTGSTDEISIKNLNFSSPVLVRAESIGGTTLTSIALTSSNNIIFSGFVYGPNSDASTLFKIVDSTNIGILRSVFDHKDIEVGQNSIIMAGSSQFVEIAYNTFRDKNVTHREGGKNTGSFIKYQFETGAGMTSDTHVHHNYFKNIPAYVATGNTEPEGDSDREAIVMGIADSQDEVTNNLVEYNLFDNCDGENEIITVKTSGNEFSNNTFVNSMGSLSFRLGHDNIAHDNQFYGSGDSAVWTDENYQTGGIRVYGEGHQVYKNYMEGLSGTTWRLPLLVDNGDSSDTLGNDNHQTPTNVNIYENTIVNSNGGVHIGRADSKYGNAPTNNFITDNTVVSSQGLLFENDAQSSTNTWSGNKVYATGSAVATSGGVLDASELDILDSTPSITQPTPLTTSDVGPTAP